MNDRQDNNNQPLIDSPVDPNEATDETSPSGGAELPEIVSEDADTARIAELEKKLQQMEEQLEIKHNSLLRTAADLDNLRKRCRREKAEEFTRGKGEVIRELLPVIDSIEMALKNADPDGPASGVLTGVEMVKKQFLTSTAQFGLERIDATGQPFDPNFHDAVAQVPSEDVEAGRVLEEMRPGYRLGERLLRASMVVVAQGRPSQDPPAELDAEEPDNADGDPPNPEETN